MNVGREEEQRERMERAEWRLQAQRREEER